MSGVIWGVIRDGLLLCGVGLMTYGVYGLWGRDAALIVLGLILIVSMATLWRIGHGPT